MGAAGCYVGERSTWTQAFVLAPSESACLEISPVPAYSESTPNPRPQHAGPFIMAPSGWLLPGTEKGGAEPPAHHKSGSRYSLGRVENALFRGGEAWALHSAGPVLWAVPCPFLRGTAARLWEQGQFPVGLQLRAGLRSHGPVQAQLAGRREAVSLPHPQR